MEQIIDELSIGQHEVKKLSEKADDTLWSSSGWIKFVAIVGLIISLISLGVKVIGIANTPSYFLTGYALTTRLVSFLSPLLGFLMAYFSLMYGIHLGRYGLNRNSRDLRLAFRNQRIYFTIVGVLFIFYLLVIVVAIVAGNLFGSLPRF
jgi:hypothetical protein